jgi:hypothetical protein
MVDEGAEAAGADAQAAVSEPAPGSAELQSCYNLKRNFRCRPAADAADRRLLNYHE